MNILQMKISSYELVYFYLIFTFFFNFTNKNFYFFLLKIFKNLLAHLHQLHKFEKLFKIPDYSLYGLNSGTLS